MDWAYKKPDIVNDGQRFTIDWKNIEKITSKNKMTTYINTYVRWNIRLKEIILRKANDDRNYGVGRTKIRY